MHSRCHASTLLGLFVTILISSAAAFSSGITITAPTSSDRFYPGDTVRVKYEAEPTIPIVIQLYRANAYELHIDSTHNNDGIYRWVVPTTIKAGDSYQVKVMVEPDSTLYGYSEPFRVVTTPHIEVTSPGKDERYSSHDPVPIEWNSHGNVGDSVRIELMVYGTFLGIIAEQTKNDGEYMWMPEKEYAEESKYQIRIWGMSGVTSVGVSEQFHLYPRGPYRKYVKVGIEPRHIEYNTETVTVLWKSDLPATNCRIELYCNDALDKVIADSVGREGSFKWAPKGLRLDRKYEIRVTSVGKDRPVYTGGNYFGFLTSLPYPTAGDTLLQGTKIKVKWPANSYGQDSIVIALRGCYPIDKTNMRQMSKVCPNTGNAEFMIPYEVHSSDRAQIVVYAGYNWHVSDTFAVMGMSALRFTAPGPDTTLESGTQCLLKWEGMEPIDGQVRLEYKLEPENNWNHIADVPAESGEYLWEVPKLEPVPCFLRISSIDRPYTGDSVMVHIFWEPTIQAHCSQSGYTEGILHLTWSNMYSPTYRVEIDTNEEFTDPMTALAKDTVFRSAMNLSPGVYFWRVWDYGREPSTSCRLEIESTEGIPVPIAVSPDPTNDATAPLRWHSVDGAEQYRLLVGTDRGFEDPLISIPTTDTFFQTNVAFPEGKIYWKVKSDLSDQYSPMQSFTVLPDSIPILVRFNGEEVSTHKPLFRWHPVEGAHEYRIQVWGPHGGGANEPLLVIHTVDTSFVPLVDLKPGEHLWHVSCDRDFELFSPRDKVMIPAGSPVVHQMRANPRHTSITAVTAPGRAPHLEYATVKGGRVSFKLFDARGNLLTFSEATHSGPGYYQMPLSGRTLAAGMYLCVARLDSKEIHKKLVIAR